MSLVSAKIEDVCLVGDGAHASIKRVSEGVPYLTSKNFKIDGLDLSKLDLISKEDYHKHFNVKSKAITKPILNFKSANLEAYKVQCVFNNCMLLFFEMV